MDRNTFTGLFLIAVILLGFSYFMRPSEAELKKESLHQDSLKAAKAGMKAAAAIAKTDSSKSHADTARVIPAGPFSAATVGNQEFVTLENDVIRLKISTKGGRVYSAQLKKFQTYSKQPLILLNGDQNVFGLNFTADQKAINTNELFFKPSAETVMVQGTDSSVLSMRLPYSDQKYIEYDYSLKNGSYMLGFTVKVVNLNDVIAAQNNALLLRWKNDILPQEKASASELRYTTVIAKDNQNDVQSPLSVSKDESKKFEKPLKWISFKQQFFSAVLLTDLEFPAADAASSQDLNQPAVVKTLSADIAIPYAHKPSDEFKMRMYLGPNDFTTLKKFGVGLEQEIPLGWGPLRWINQYAVIPVFSMLSKMNWNYGIIILILTILLKAVLFPLTYRSYLSTAKMRVIKPEMDEIKDKIGDSDPTKLQQEYLKLYKKAGVNPLGGCLPMLLQMPILFAFLNFFPNAFELRQQHFLFMEDLSTYDSIIHWSGDIPIISSIFGNHLSVMCILMAATTLIYSILNSQVSAGGPAGNQYKYMSYIFPIMSIAFLNKYSAGLNYYYFCANIITFSQQAIIRRFVNDDEIHRRIQENKKKPVITKKSKFQAKLEEMSKQRNLATTGGKVIPAKTVPNRPAKK